MRQYKRMLLIFFVSSLVYLNQPMKANAWFFSWGEGERHDRDRGYTEVVVGGDRYYYNEGVYYRGAPGSYVVVQAPIGAVVYGIPAGYERVYIDGETYFVYRDVYYRPVGRGYAVVERPHRHEQDNRYRHDDQERHEH